ncbi:hypothetical protein Agub_g4430 [Astrephomene gubernaculifera]|uniref:Ribonuclease H n=1 Tax=Astrephomene gubernaculifera TaxID=47775 RepID=A0AAD3DLH4_9CHLO|nr:hypothetical protein Agub_g4430 [Astrephomene gubernaculifera]
MGGKYYAVRVGRRPGIYEDWGQVKPLVEGYPGAQHKSFKSRDEAMRYLSNGPSAAAGSKRRRDDYDDDSDDDRYHRPPPPAYRQSNPYRPPAPQPHPYPSRQPVIMSLTVPSSRDNYDGGYRSSGGGGSSSFPFHRSSSAPGGLERRGSSGVYDPVVEGPLQPVRSNTLYQLEFDGASRGNPGKAGCGAVLRRLDTGDVVCRLRKYMGSNSTNNEAEYTALLEGLKMARRLGVTRLQAQGDSKLVVQQVQGRWAINKDHLRALCDQVKQETRHFQDFNIRHVLRHLNGDADKLSNDAIDLAYR